MNKEDLLMLLRQPVAFHPVLASAAGGATAGLFLSQLFYWTGKGEHPGGWIYKDWKEWEGETCLTQDEQRGARRKLEKLGVIEVSDMRTLKIDKFSPTLCYRICFGRLFECIQHANAPESSAVASDGNFPSRSGKIPSRRAGNPTPEGRKSHSRVGKTTVHSTETTPETTSETTTTRDPPSLWLEAVEVEIEISEKLGKPVFNRDKYSKKVLETYKKDGGPGPGVLKQGTSQKTENKAR